MSKIMKTNGFSYIEILVGLGIWLTLLTIIIQFNSQYRSAYCHYVKLAEENNNITNLLENNLATSFEQASGHLLAPDLKSVMLTPQLELYKHDE